LTIRDQPLSFRVWSRHPAYVEDPKPWKCIAAFRFLLECLDYIAYCQDSGSDVVFQSPAEIKLIKATDRRVVYKPESA
jgi:hypothetical protein